jgi:ABC-2 type transport system ATP-binding protein
MAGRPAPGGSTPFPGLGPTLTNHCSPLREIRTLGYVFRLLILASRGRVVQEPDNHVQTTPAKTGTSAAPSAPRSAEPAVIQTDRLVKQFGRITALNGLSIRVERGEIFGLLGQNGAGKTTLIKILLGILKPTEGDASLLREPVGSVGVLRRVGYLPEDHRFPEYHSAASLLDFYGSLLEMPAQMKKQRIPEVLELVGIKGRMHYKIRTYSKGMKQRLGIAQALMHNPEVIFLDEPTDGVDPVGRREIRETLTDLKGRGVTIFLNSHLLGEVELICDRVVILDRGEIIRQGSISELTEQKGTFRVGLADRQAFPLEEVRQLGYAAHRAGEHYEIVLKDQQTIDPVVDLIRSKGLSLRHLVEKRQTLEDLFVQTVEAVEPGMDQRGRRREVGSAERRPPRERDPRDRDSREPRR